MRTAVTAAEPTARCAARCRRRRCAERYARFDVYSAPSGPFTSPFGRLANPVSTSLRSPVLGIERDEVGAVGRPWVVVGEDLDAVQPVAAPRQADDRVERLERQRVAREVLVELARVPPVRRPRRRCRRRSRCRAGSSRSGCVRRCRSTCRTPSRSRPLRGSTRSSMPRLVSTTYRYLPCAIIEWNTPPGSWSVVVRVRVLDEERRVLREPGVQVGDVGRGAVGVDPQDRGQVVGQRVRAAAHFDQHVERAADERHVGRAEVGHGVVGHARQAVGHGLASCRRPARGSRGRCSRPCKGLKMLTIDRATGVDVGRDLPAADAGLGHVQMAVRDRTTRPRGLVRPVAYVVTVGPAAPRLLPSGRAGVSAWRTPAPAQAIAAKAVAVKRVK